MSYPRRSTSYPRRIHVVSTMYHVAHASYPRRIHVVSTSYQQRVTRYTRRIHVASMSYPRRATSYTRRFHVVSTSYPLRITSYPCRTHSLTRRIHVVSTSYPRRITSPIDFINIHCTEHVVIACPADCNSLRTGTFTYSSVLVSGCVSQRCAWWLLSSWALPTTRTPKCDADATIVKYHHEARLCKYSSTAQC